MRTQPKSAGLFSQTVSGGPLLKSLLISVVAIPCKGSQAHYGYCPAKVVNAVYLGDEAGSWS